MGLKTNPLLTEVYGFQSDSRRVNYSRDRLMNSYPTELTDGFQTFNICVPSVGASIFRRVLDEIRLGYSKATVVCQQRAIRGLWWVAYILELAVLSIL